MKRRAKKRIWMFNWDNLLIASNRLRLTTRWEEKTFPFEQNYFLIEGFLLPRFFPAFNLLLGSSWSSLSNCFECIAWWWQKHGLHLQLCGVVSLRTFHASRWVAFVFRLKRNSLSISFHIWRSKIDSYVPRAVTKAARFQILSRFCLLSAIAVSHRNTKNNMKTIG